MTEAEFNLLYEKWIPVVNKEDCVEEVSLMEAFENAHEYQALSGDVPTQDAVLLRLMLAILYCVYLRKDQNGEDSEILDEDDAVGRWSALWERGSFDMEAIGSYLKSYESRFYLFHPDRPFYQANITLGTNYAAAKLNGAISESSNKPRLCSERSGTAKEKLSFNEAARWLMYLNAFDDTSSKPSIHGLPPSGVGWLGKLGIVLVSGKNLFQTILLNFVLHMEDLPMKDGLAVWEEEKVRVDERVEVPLPDNLPALLTMQNRRILLKRDGDFVIGYRLLGGDIVQKEDSLIEQMTVWKCKDNVWSPKRHDPSRAIWRDFSSLLIRSEPNSGRREPGVIHWVSELMDRGLIDSNTIEIRTIGVKYADKDFFVDGLIDDSIRINSKMLLKLNEQWNVRIDREVSKTEDCVQILGKLAYNLASYNGLDKDGLSRASDKARERGYMVLDQPFRRWLSSIDPEQDMESKLSEWDSIMEKILLKEGQSMVADSNTRVLLGKIVDEKPKNAFTAFRSFRSRILGITRGQNNE